MSLKLITAPTEVAVTVAELKASLRGAEDAEDDDLGLKLTAATELVAAELRRCLITATYDLHLAAWPCRQFIELPLGNLQSVAYIKYTDAAGTLNTVDPSWYKLTRTYTPSDDDTDGDGVLDAGAGRVWLAYARYWPTAILDTGEPITIRFTCGWDGAASVPTPIKQAILMLGAHWFRNREAVQMERGVVSEEVALGITRLCSMYELRGW